MKNKCNKCGVIIGGEPIIYANLCQDCFDYLDSLELE